MEYIDLDTEIEIRFKSERLDMLQLGYLNLGMHRILNRIALDMLTAEGWLTGPLPTDISSELVLVRGVATSFENGSFVTKIRLKVASVVSPENLQRFSRDFVISVMANSSRRNHAIAASKTSCQFATSSSTGKTRHK